MKELVLIGGGGHCKSVIDVAEKAGFSILAILDVSANIGKKVLGHTVVGTDNDISNYVDKAMFLVTVGQIKSASIRIGLHEKVVALGGCLATVVSPLAHVSPYAEIGEGTVIMHQVVVNAGTVIGKGCIINTFSNVEHDTVIDDYCHISTGAMVNGGCQVGKGTFLGSQSVVVNGVSITSGCVIAAGSVVRKNLSVSGTYLGNPAILKINC